MPNLVSLAHPSPQILGKTQIGVFPISRFFFNHSRTSDDIDMKLGPETKLDNRSKTTSKKFDNGVMLGDCDVIMIFPIYGQYGAIRKLNSGRIVCKTYIFINSNL